MNDKERNEVDSEFAKLTYNQFVSSIEIHYGELLKFIAIILPALTGYAFVATSFVNETTTVEILFIATLAVISILSWGISIAFAMSYRFRYLQYVLSNIEQKYDLPPKNQSTLMLDWD